MVALAVFFPLLGIALNLTVCRRWREPAAGIIASGAAALAFLASAAHLFTPLPTSITLGQWLHVGGFLVDWTLQADSLSVTMMLLVTGVGTLIHVYAIGYMHGDPRFSRFFIYLNLFLAAMLLLVTADNFLVLFAGWEGVGLCSFLLIGFWFDQTGNGTRISSAARKAFIANRIGDAGLLIALFLMARNFGSLDFETVFSTVQSRYVVGEFLVTVITLFMFIGVTGKSAQIPLFVWLPDAMAGPTPVSALIHAATMVTAGVYLIVRSSALFDLAPLTQIVVTATGAATALLAASIAVSQFDIKRVLAYSTISQLGFMIAGVGMGAYTASMFHLITHAFFKALLFLAAGAILHATGTQDARALGGLRTRTKVTFAAYLVGALALAGVPPLAGFFSKDGLLAAAAEHSLILYAVLAAASFLTAFYITRQIMLIFAGEPRSDAAQHAHEAPRSMRYPLIALALLAALGGVLNLPGSDLLSHWLGGEPEALDTTVALLSSLIALAGIALAYRLYRSSRGVEPLAGRVFEASLAGWSIDALYDAIVVRPFKWLTNKTAAADNAIFYGLDDAATAVSQRTADRVRRTQTGQLNWNVAGIVGGLIVVLLIVIFGRPL